MNFKYLHITYSNNNLQNPLEVRYRLRDTPIAKKWMERVLVAQQLGYSIDDPARFYGFGSLEEQTNQVLKDINALLDKLENFWRIPIGRRLERIDDQDSLNYFHHIFEVEHGLLNEKKLNPQFQKHISQLNILVHRCESVARGAKPRHIVTYFDLPKDVVLSDDDYQHFTPNVQFGTVYLNYVEIGKTLYDFMIDNDKYIDPNAFRPFCHYSADFVVNFFNKEPGSIQDNLYAYFTLHKEFFENLGYTWDNLAQSIGSIPVADLDYSGDILKDLETRQFVKAVHFS